MFWNEIDTNDFGSIIVTLYKHDNRKKWKIELIREDPIFGQSVDTSNQYSKQKRAFSAYRRELRNAERRFPFRKW